MDEWVDAVEKHGKTISLSEIEIDEDLLNAVQKQQLQHKDLDSWIIRKEDVQEFYEWMPVHVHMPGNEIRIYCILDSDYHTLAEIQFRLEEARKHQVELHIWQKKEIENYLLIP